MKRFIYIYIYKRYINPLPYGSVAALERADTCRGLQLDWKQLIMNLLSRECFSVVVAQCWRNTQHMKRPVGRSSPFSAPNGAPDPDVHARVETSRWQKPLRSKRIPTGICAGCYCTGAEHCVEAVSTYPVSRVLLRASMVPLEPRQNARRHLFLSFSPWCSSAVVYIGAPLDALFITRPW